MNLFQVVRLTAGLSFAFVPRSIVARTIAGCECGDQYAAPEIVWRGLSRIPATASGYLRGKWYSLVNPIACPSAFDGAYTR
jgi:hypothetical protein